MSDCLYNLQAIRRREIMEYF